jgi:hypothetical protein
METERVSETLDSFCVFKLLIAQERVSEYGRHSSWSHNIKAILNVLGVILDIDISICSYETYYKTNGQYMIFLK